VLYNTCSALDKVELKDRRVRREWFQIESEELAQLMAELKVELDIALENRDFVVVDGRYLILRCSVGHDDIAVTTEKCPFCGRKHHHGTGGKNWRGHVEIREGRKTLGHRVAHCGERGISIMLPDGRRVTNDDGYYLGVLV
jgi:hypothetical protein